jgi:radical SAM superfamily enzyme YgiQ (UPF0313 family)
MGEGEATAAELFETLKAGGDLRRVKGIWFRDEKGRIVQNTGRTLIKDLNDIPLPAWDLFPMEIYLKNPVGAPNRNKWTDGSVDDQKSSLSMNICATRGCPYKCIYCYHDFMGPVYRHRSASNIVEEMKVLSEIYNVGYFHFTDDEFCLKKAFVYEFCKKVKKNFNGKITWGCSGRVNLMTEDLIATMADAGCVLIGYGIESGSQKMLNAMKKAVTVEQAKNSIRWTEKYMGWADCSFIVGLPGENEETLRETIDFCKDLNLVPEVIFFATPYPGTELYEMALAQGKIADEEEYLLGLGEQGEKVRVNFTDFTDEELFDIQERMIQELDAWNKVKHPESR